MASTGMSRDGTSIAYDIQGEGSAVLFVTAALNLRAAVAPLSASLARRRRAGMGVRVVLGSFALPVCGSRRTGVHPTRPVRDPALTETVEGNDEASRLRELILADDRGGAVRRGATPLVRRCRRGVGGGNAGRPFAEGSRARITAGTTRR
jgi:hypothetical protein